MAHTMKDKEKLLARVARIRGQIGSIEKALGEEEQDCSAILQQIAACRGAINSLMSEVLEGHIRFHVMDPKVKPSRDQVDAVEELVDVIRAYIR